MNNHKSAFFLIVGLSFLAGCFVTCVSMGLGFAYYLRSGEKESYKAYEIEMADETLPTEEDVEINSGPPR